MPKAKRDVADDMEQFVSTAHDAVLSSQNKTAARASASADRHNTSGDGGGGVVNQTILNQTINTHDSLSPAEITKEGEDFVERSQWKLK